MSSVDQPQVSARDKASLVTDNTTNRQSGESDSLSAHRLDKPGSLNAVRQLNGSPAIAETGMTGVLPAVTFVGTEGVPGKARTDSTASFKFGGIWNDVKQSASTVGKVGEQLLIGAANEVINHPGTLLKDAAIGAATGAAMTFLPALIVPAALVAGYELVKNRRAILNDGEEFLNDVKILNSGSTASSGDVNKANESLGGFGSTGAEVVAGVAGGVAGSALMRAAIAMNAASTSVQAIRAERNAMGVASQTASEHIHYTDTGLVDEQGIFSDYQFQAIDHSRELDFKDTWQVNGSRADVEADLEKAGFQRWKTGFHFGDEEWRLPADSRGSIHFNIANSVKDAVTGAWKTLGNVHGYEFDPGTHMVEHFLHDVVRL